MKWDPLYPRVECATFWHPACFMFKYYSHRSFRYLAKWQNFIKNNLELQWPLWGIFQLDNIAHLRNALERKRSQVEQIEWDVYFNWHSEASKSLQNSKIASLKDSLQKANEKLKIQEVPKTTDNRTDVTPPPPPILSLPEYSCFTNSLSEPPVHSEDTTKQLLFKIKLPKVIDESLQVSFTCGQRLN